MTDNRIYYPQQPVLPVSYSTQETKAAGKNTNSSDFDQILTQKLSGVKFSQHALQRLQSRNIELKPEELDKLDTAVNKAASKGAKESLVLMNNLALVVSVTNKTVITAMDGASMKDNVFTNIDSAVIV